MHLLKRSLGEIIQKKHGYTSDHYPQMTLRVLRLKQSRKPRCWWEHNSKILFWEEGGAAKCRFLSCVMAWPRKTPSRGVWYVDATCTQPVMASACKQRHVHACTHSYRCRVNLFKSWVSIFYFTGDFIMMYFPLQLKWFPTAPYGVTPIHVLFPGSDLEWSYTLSLVLWARKYTQWFLIARTGSNSLSLTLFFIVKMKTK